MFIHLPFPDVKKHLFLTIHEKKLDNSHFFYTLKQDKINPIYGEGIEIMTKKKKTQGEIIDNIYSLAFWMTGDHAVCYDLIKKTYLYAEPGSNEQVLLRTFRDCYVEQFGQEVNSWFSDEMHNYNIMPLGDGLEQFSADIKIAVLLSEIAGLTHRQIAEIFEQKLETVRCWLFWGRKVFVHNYLMRESA